MFTGISACTYIEMWYHTFYKYALKIRQMPLLFYFHFSLHISVLQFKLKKKLKKIKFEGGAKGGTPPPLYLTVYTYICMIDGGFFSQCFRPEHYIRRQTPVPRHAHRGSGVGTAPDVQHPLQGRHHLLPVWHPAVPHQTDQLGVHHWRNRAPAGVFGNSYGGSRVCDLRTSSCTHISRIFH